MALGIGATTATFSIVEALLLRPLPYPAPERLVWAWGQRAGGVQQASVNPQEFLDYRAQARAFSQFAATTTFAQTSTLTGVGDPTALKIGVVSGNYLDAIGAPPLAGRTLRIDDEQAGHTDVVVLSHATWRTLFHGADSIVGSSIRLDDRSVTVVGVMPADFLPPQSADGWRNTCPFTSRLRIAARTSCGRSASSMPASRLSTPRRNWMRSRKASSSPTPRRVPAGACASFRSRRS